MAISSIKQHAFMHDTVFFRTICESCTANAYYCHWPPNL